MSMNFEMIVNQILSEDLVSGGAGSVFGPNVTSTSSGFSGDNYAPGDARVAKGLYGGVLSRFGMKSNKGSKKKKKKKKK